MAFGMWTCFLFLCCDDLLWIWYPLQWPSAVTVVTDYLYFILNRLPVGLRLELVQLDLACLQMSARCDMFIIVALRFKKRKPYEYHKSCNEKTTCLHHKAL